MHEIAEILLIVSILLLLSKMGKIGYGFWLILRLFWSGLVCKKYMKESLDHNLH